MMKKKVKITAAISVAIVSLLMIPLHNQMVQEPTVPEARPVSAPTTSSRDNTTLTENKALTGEETAEISTQNLLQYSAPIEADSEPPRKADSKEISSESNASRDNLTPTPAPSKSKTSSMADQPKMGDTRTVDGHKQVYFLGFGWIEDNDEPNECIYAEDMYQNGNMVGSMGGGIIGKSNGDINKMVGRMN